MKEIIIPSYGEGDLRDVIHGRTMHSDYTYEEFCKGIDESFIETIPNILPCHYYGILQERSKYITALMQFFAGDRDKKDVFIRHCDTYLTDYPSNGGKWRVQLHINIAAYPDCVVLLDERNKKKYNYQAFFSGKDNIVLTLYVNDKLTKIPEENE